LNDALEMIQNGVELGRQWNAADFQALAFIELADAYFSLGEKDLARDSLQESLNIFRDFSPWAAGLVAARQAKYSLGFGETAPAFLWLEESDLDPAGPIDLSRDVEYLAMARVLIAQNNLAAGLSLLERIFDFSNEIGKKSTTLETLILQVLAMFESGETSNALDKLAQALTLSQPEEYISMYVDEGPSMARLLYEALSRGVAPAYVQKLLAAFPLKESKEVAAKHMIVTDSEWIDPVSERELEVLHLLSEGLSRQEIASKLFLSPNTVKTHTRNIYSKLGVNNRMQAVGKARGLGLLDTD
jgi:LuxR family maltose regulon positive regulatory protein